MTRARSGTLLIELMASLVAGSLIMLLAIGLIHQSMSWSTRTQARNDLRRTLEHLARQWRRDARVANSISLDSDQQIVFNGVEGENVTYRVSGNEITRIQSAPASENSDSFHRDQFLLDARCSIELKQLDEPKRACFQVRHSVPGVDREQVEVSVESVVGRWTIPGGGS